MTPRARRSSLRLSVRNSTANAAESDPKLSNCRSEEHTSELQSPCNLVCRLLLEKKKKKNTNTQDRYQHVTSLLQEERRERHILLPLTKTHSSRIFLLLDASSAHTTDSVIMSDNT